MAGPVNSYVLSWIIVDQKVSRSSRTRQFGSDLLSEFKFADSASYA